MNPHGLWICHGFSAVLWLLIKQPCVVVLRVLKVSWWPTIVSTVAEPLCCFPSLPWLPPGWESTAYLPNHPPRPEIRKNKIPWSPSPPPKRNWATVPSSIAHPFPTSRNHSRHARTYVQHQNENVNENSQRKRRMTRRTGRRRRRRSTWKHLEMMSSWSETWQRQLQQL